MPRITHAEAYLVDIDVETVRTDAVQSFIKQETVFVDVTVDDGGSGKGYAYTIGTGGTAAVVALLRDSLLPRLVGADPRRIEMIWRDLFAANRSTTVGAITSLALAAVDTALWDWRCRAAGCRCGCSPAVRRTASRSTTPRAAGCTSTPRSWSPGAKASQAAGWPGVKLKVGRSPVADAERHRSGTGRGRPGAGRDGRREPVADRRRGDPPGPVAGAVRPVLVRGADAGRRRGRARRAGGRRPASRSRSASRCTRSTQFAEYLHRRAAGIVQVDVARSAASRRG